MAKTPKPRKKGNRWEINYTDENGKRRFETYRTRAEAQRALHLRHAEVLQRKSGLLPAVDRDKTWADLVGLWEEVKHDKRTLNDDLIRIRRHMTPTLGNKRLADIDARLISRLDRDLRKRMSIGTVRQVLGTLRAMLNVAVEHGWLASRPTIRLPRAEDTPYQWIRSEQDMGKLLAAAATRRVPGTMQLYATALYTGMRAGELAGLNWDDISFEHRLITVQRSWDQPTTKTGATRRVPILDPLLPVLQGWRSVGFTSEVVFANERGNRHAKTARVFTKTYKTCLEKAELPTTLRFHDLRHTFASHWMLKGGDLFRLQKILGHKSIAMTQRYAHLAPDAFKQDWGRFGDFVPGGVATDDVRGGPAA